MKTCSMSRPFVWLCTRPQVCGRNVLLRNVLMRLRLSSLRRLTCVEIKQDSASNSHSLTISKSCLLTTSESLRTRCTRTQRICKKLRNRHLKRQRKMRKLAISCFQSIYVWVRTTLRSRESRSVKKWKRWSWRTRLKSRSRITSWGKMSGSPSKRKPHIQASLNHLIRAKSALTTKWAVGTSGRRCD